MDHTNNNTKRTMFHKPKLVDAVKVEGRSIFFPGSYYFAWYDDGSYSLYDGESLKYLGGVKRFNFGSIVSGSQRVAKFDRPTEIGAEYRLFYDAVHTIEQNKSLEAQKIARELGVHQSHLVSMYYYNPDDYLLCEECFRKYNSGFQENLHNFISTRKSLSKKIDDLIAFNSGKSEKLIKKIMLEKCKEVLENRIKQEETKINKIQEENKKYETPITILKDNISGFNNILKDYGNDSNNEDIKNDIFKSSINLSNLNIG